MSTQSDESLETVPGTVFNARQIRLLKIVVVAMGLMLIGGFVLVVATIVYQSMYSSGSTTSSAASAPSPEHSLSIGSDSKVAGMAVNGDRLAIHIEGPNTSEIVIVGIRSGRVLSRVRLRGD